MMGNNLERKKNQNQRELKISPGDTHSLKVFLEKLYVKYTNKNFIHTDPVSLVHSYKSSKDREIAGFLVSTFSLGRVENIISYSDDLLTLMGKNPWHFIKNGTDIKKIKKRLKTYRFFTPEDVYRVLIATSLIIKEHKSLKNFFCITFKRNKRCLRKSTEEFMKEMRRLCRLNSHGIKMAFPSPYSGPCKRWNMFLRWMVRSDEVDFGIWQFIKPSELVIPLDTHIMRVSLSLGLTKKSTPSWETAQEITESLKKFDPDDPVKYDFALMRQGFFETRKGSNKNGKKK